MHPLGPAYLTTVTRLTTRHLDQIEQALTRVGDEDIWTRANPASNSIGNLLLHLAGSHRFWIVSVVGRQPSARQRQAEFDASGGPGKADLLAGLRLSVADANDVLAGLEPDSLLEPREAFGRNWTVLEAIQHTTVHFALHAGQILQMVKAMKGVDLALPL